MKNSVLLTIIVLAAITLNLQAQTHVNREWKTHNGNPRALQWSKSITNAFNQLITVGNTQESGQGANILTTKFNQDGSIQWQSTFNTSGSHNDYGVALTEDDAGNIIVVGTTDNSSSTNYDVIVLKYTSSGVLLWSADYNSPFNLNDIATSVKADNSGNVFVAASSIGSTTNFDFLVLKYNSSGTMLWNNRYDYASLIEIPVGIETDANGNAFITGASASSNSNWDYTIAKFSASGAYLGDVRNALPGVGFDQPLAYKKDAAGNIYITGRSSTNGINYDIRTIKLNANYVLQWSKIFDFVGREDVGDAIDVDTIGNVYISGYITNSNNVKEMFVIKYDASGNELWQHRQAGAIGTADAFVKAIEARPNGEIYFVGEEKGPSGTRDGVVSKIDLSGALEWQRKLSNSFDEKPTNINVANDGSVYVTALKDSSTVQYEILKYQEFQQNSNVVFNPNGDPLFKDNELIVRFKPSALIISAADNRTMEFGGIDYYLQPDALSQFNNALRAICVARIILPDENNVVSNTNPCGIKAIKVFKQLTSTYTTTLSRLGENIKIPDFWTTLLLVFPTGMEINQVHSALQTIPEIVAYSEPNFIATTTQGANDSEYQVQHSLHDAGDYPQAHINVEQAWDIIPSGGSPTIRCGVFDTGLDWVHEDFGYDGSDPSSSTVIDGWDFQNNHETKATTEGDIDGHGTPCGGIIGAVRNNNLGVAGIAGGNLTNGTTFANKGVSLYSMRIIDPPFNSTFNYIYDAIVTSAIDDSSLDYAFGLHLSSNSWGIFETEDIWFSDTNRTLLREATHFANRAKVTFVAARGNEGYDNLAYPAIIDDDWILNVGGTGLNGDYKYSNNGDAWWMPSFGHNVDVAAPSALALVQTTKYGGGYDQFNGTSAAAPHFAGVVSLMMSYINTPSPSYQNLAPEDCERIVELSATDVNLPGYDERTGFGRLDAGKAMKLIEQPWNAVNHFGTNFLSAFTKSKSLQSAGDTILLRERFQNEAGVWFNRGNYIVNTYKIDATVNHSLTSLDSIVAFWPRPSSSTVIEPLVGDSLLPRERITINTCTQTACNMTGYIYQVFDLSGNPLGWWPFDTTLINSQFEYTILTRNKLAPNSVNETVKDEWVTLFPNPSNQMHTLSINVKDIDNLSIHLYDVQGRLLRTVYSGKSHQGEIIIPLNVADLQPAVYFYRIQLGNEHKQLRFVKQ